MTWIYYTITSITALVTKDSLLKKASSKHNVNELLSFQFFIAAIVVFVIAKLKDVDLAFDREAIYFMILGVIVCIGSIGKANAIRVNMSASAIIQSFSPLFPIILAVIFLGELKYFSINSLDGTFRLISVLLFPLSLLLIRSSKLGAKGESNIYWVINIALMLIFHGLTHFLQKYLLDYDNIWKSNVYIRGATAVTMFLYMFVSGGRWRIEKGFVKYGLINGILTSVSTTTNRLATISSPLSIYLSFRKPISIIASTLSGFIFFKERKRISRLQILGFLVSIFVLIMILYTSLSL